MANYEEIGRTNYFKVKDIDAFKKALSKFNDVKIDAKEPDEDGHAEVTLLFGYGVPFWWIEDEGPDAEDEEIDFMVDYVAPHLVEGEVAVLQAVGWEKLRYVNGYSQAVNHKGDSVVCHIDDIYAKAEDAFGADKWKIPRAYGRIRH